MERAALATALTLHSSLTIASTYSEPPTISLDIDGRMTGNAAWLGTLASLRGAQKVIASDDVEGSLRRGCRRSSLWPRRLANKTLDPLYNCRSSGLSAYGAAWPNRSAHNGGESARSLPSN